MTALPNMLAYEEDDRDAAERPRAERAAESGARAGGRGGASPASGAVPVEDRNFLAMYFKEMAQLDVLRPEQEFSAAREIERLEIDLWEALLSHPPAVAALVRVVERAIGQEVKALRQVRAYARRAGARPGRTRRERLRRLATQAGARLRELDIDRHYVTLAIRELGRMARGERQAPRGRAPSPDSPAMREWVARVGHKQHEVRKAKNDFVKANLRLVVSIARRFNHGRMPLADLIQEGNIGLLKAVERFDYRRGFRFSTYASWWIRHAISRALADKGRAVRLPVHMIDAYHRVAKSTRELQNKLGRPPTSEEIGAATGMGEAKVEKMRGMVLDHGMSLDRPVGDDDERKFIDFLTDPEGTPTLTDKLVLQATTEAVRRLLDNLKPIEADILRRRFGLDTDNEQTLKEIGEKYQLSRERIRQLQEQALEKMRKALDRQDLL